MYICLVKYHFYFLHVWINSVLMRQHWKFCLLLHITKPYNILINIYEIQFRVVSQEIKNFSQHNLNFLLHLRGKNLTILSKNVVVLVTFFHREHQPTIFSIQFKFIEWSLIWAKWIKMSFSTLYSSCIGINVKKGILFSTLALKNKSSHSCSLPTQLIILQHKKIYFSKLQYTMAATVCLILGSRFFFSSPSQGIIKCHLPNGTQMYILHWIIIWLRPRIQKLWEWQANDHIPKRAHQPKE